MPSPRTRTELATIIGIVVAVGSIFMTTVLNTGGLEAMKGLLHLGPVVLIVGGTVGVTFISYPLSDLKRMPALIWQTIQPPDLRMQATIDFITELADQARRKGILSLQDEAVRAPDPFLARGINLLVDGTDSETIYTVLSSEIKLETARQRRLAGMFETAGGYAPTIGIIGTVMELVHVLPNMSDATKLGQSIAGAFLATFYGIVTANYFWLPIGKKLKTQAAARENYGEMVIEGLLLILDGQASRFLRERLVAYLDAPPAIPRRGSAL